MGVGEFLIRLGWAGSTVLHAFALLPSTMQESSPNIGMCSWISRALALGCPQTLLLLYPEVFRYSTGWAETHLLAKGDGECLSLLLWPPSVNASITVVPPRLIS